MQVVQTHLRARARGQGISEYAAVIAFVSVLISIAFGLSQGHMAPAVQSTFSVVTVQMNNLTGEAGDAI